MKRSIQLLTVIILLLSISLKAQNITNTLGTGGVFKVKDGSNDFFTLSQSNGNVNIQRNLDIRGTSSSSVGVITKAGNRFLHTYGIENLFLGINAGNFTMTGRYNSAVGVNSLYSNTTAYYNSAFGYNSLFSNTSGESNSAFGVYSLQFNTIGEENSAFGWRSLLNNSSGNFNSAFGVSSLYNNTTGNDNSAFGSYSLRGNTTGYQNTALGGYSLYVNDSGKQNTAVGYKSLHLNVSGFQNTAVGDSALYKNTGNYNTAIGYNAGSNVTTGANLTLIGIDANPSSGSAIDEITLGNIYVQTLRCNRTSITALSDKRDKKNITDLALGLDFITKLKPRQFNWDKRDWYENQVSDGSKMEEKLTAGFIAQELDSIQKAENAEWLDLVLKSNPEKWEATPGNLFPVVVKAIQELKQENDDLRSEIENLKSLKEQLAEIQNIKAELIEQINELKTDAQTKEIKFTINKLGSE